MTYSTRFPCNIIHFEQFSTGLNYPRLVKGIMVSYHFTKDKTNNFENILRPIDEDLWEVRGLDLFAL
jgi:hypothetical protein